MPTNLDFKQNNTHLMFLLNSWTKPMELSIKMEFLLTIFLDFSKAFDTVDHESLLKNVLLWFRGSNVDWLRFF